jgi:hypothetical protein
MSESLFLNRNVQEFSLSHPQEEGWKVYELPETVLCQYSFRHLPDFLRDRHPDVVRCRSMVNVIAEEELTGTPEYPHPAEVGTEWDLRQELDGSHWFGLIHIEWMEQPIHFLRFCVFDGRGYFSMIRVATKSNVALRRFAQELNAYGLTRQKVEARKIRVVNGDDIPIAPVPWDEIALPAGFAESIKRNVDGFFQSKERYRALGIPYRRGLLFAGPPGCGKTLTLKALAYEQNAQIVTVLGKADVEDHHIETAFQIAGAQSPSIVFFEDLDKLVESKGLSLSHFLNILDGFKTLNGLMVIATANEPERLDPALLYRPSRFDRMWTFPLPAREQRLALLRKRGAKYFSDSALEEAARRSHGFSMAYVQEIVVNALMECAHTQTALVDESLLNSVEVLRTQRRTVAKSQESLNERETVGFCGSNNGAR